SWGKTATTLKDERRKNCRFAEMSVPRFYWLRPGVKAQIFGLFRRLHTSEIIPAPAFAALRLRFRNPRNLDDRLMRLTVVFRAHRNRRARLRVKFACIQKRSGRRE